MNNPVLFIKLPAVKLTAAFPHGVTGPNMLPVRTTEVPPIYHVNNQKAYSAEGRIFQAFMSISCGHVQHCFVARQPLNS
jgi:hypothetical protein